MKQALTLLILCFAFVANAQINFGVSVSEGIDFILHPQVTSLGTLNEGIYLVHGISKHRVAKSIGLLYTPFLIKGALTFTNVQGDVTGTAKECAVFKRVTLPIQLWCNILSRDAKRKFGFEVGTSANYILSDAIYYKSSTQFQTVNGIPVKPNRYNKIDSTPINKLFFGDEFGIFRTISTPIYNAAILNAGINYSHDFSNQYWDFTSVFFKLIVLFGK